VHRAYGEAGDNIHKDCICCSEDKFSSIHQIVNVIQGAFGYFLKQKFAIDLGIIIHMGFPTTLRI